MTGSDRARLEALETEIAHLVRAHEQLNEVLYERGRTVDSLERLVRRLTKKVEGLESAAKGGTEADEFSGGELTEGFEFGLDGEPRN